MLPGFFNKKDYFMAAEKILRVVPTTQGSATAIPARNARQTYVPLPARPAGTTAQYGAKVPTVLAPNARQTHV
jgi:hypothetical protein